MTFIKIFTTLLIISTFSSCTNKTFSNKEDLLAYIYNSNNDYISSKTFDGIKVTALYKPKDLLINQEIYKEITADELVVLRNKYKDYIYFQINFEDILNKTNSNNRLEDRKFFESFNFKMKELISLYSSNNEELKLIEYISPRSFGIDRKRSVLLAFENNLNALKNSSYVTLRLNDFGLLNRSLRFKISTSKILNEPTLKFKTILN